MVTASTNVVSIAQYKRAKQPGGTPQALHFSPVFTPENSEDVQFLPGSESKPAHLSHSWENRPPAAPLTSSTPLGDAALESIYRLLRNRRAASVKRSAIDVPTWRLQGS
ncbi:hypothetical protein FEP08_05636 [Burkholderia multivorans]|nr:hypothetical protein [Burkholderia multivorans]